MTGDVSGADVVVLAAGSDAAIGSIRDSAPAAVVLVTAEPVEDWCRRVYEGTLFPRARIVGVPDAGGVAAAAAAILFGRGDEHDVVAMVDGEFGARRARLGAGGITALV